MLKYLRYFGTHILILSATVGFFVGGAWYWLGLAAGFVIWVGGDALSPPVAPNAQRYANPVVLDAALYSLFPSLLVLCFSFAWALSGTDLLGVGAWITDWSSHDAVRARASASLIDYLGACLSFGLSMAMGGILTAHELSHRTSDRVAMWFARWMLAMAFNASLEVAHVFGHHRDVGTPADPATARRNESIYHFFVRSTFGQFYQAWRIESARLHASARSPFSLRNKVVGGMLRSGLVSGLYFLVGGWFAFGAFLLSSIWNKFLLETLNYIEHYGLVRVPGEPIEARHAWDSTSSFSHAALFDLPWHADHHRRIGLHYPALKPSPNAPVLPRGYLATLPIVWVPPMWRRYIGHRLAKWDASSASNAERLLIE